MRGWSIDEGTLLRGIDGIFNGMKETTTDRKFVDDEISFIEIDG